MGMCINIHRAILYHFQCCSLVVRTIVSASCVRVGGFLGKNIVVKSKTKTENSEYYVPIVLDSNFNSGWILVA